MANSGTTNLFQGSAILNTGPQANIVAGSQSDHNEWAKVEIQTGEDHLPQVARDHRDAMKEFQPLFPAKQPTRTDLTLATGYFILGLFGIGI